MYSLFSFQVRAIMMLISLCMCLEAVPKAAAMLPSMTSGDLTWIAKSGSDLWLQVRDKMLIFTFLPGMKATFAWQLPNPFWCWSQRRLLGPEVLCQICCVQSLNSKKNLYFIISLGALPNLLYCCVNSFVWFSQVLVPVWYALWYEVEVRAETESWEL